jgi:hypothetical protein
VRGAEEFTQELVDLCDAEVAELALLFAGEPDEKITPEPDALEIATDQAIAACDGDVRATVRALVVANSLLEAKLNDVYAAASKGYARGRVRNKQD